MTPLNFLLWTLFYMGTTLLYNNHFPETKENIEVKQEPTLLSPVTELNNFKTSELDILITENNSTSWCFRPFSFLDVLLEEQSLLTNLEVGNMKHLEYNKCLIYCHLSSITQNCFTRFSGVDP